jgi:hypothetical protein
MVRVSGLNASVVSGRFWCTAILTTADAIGFTPRADAALYYLQDPDAGFYRPAPPMHMHRHKARTPSGKKNSEKETAAKPQGPLVIAVSIGRQNVKVYDANGFFAEAPVSTGMPGHSTPTGVFSVIQKHRLHHSNIYSGAPMPYMQRITWSGIALHAGVLPGYPASHGCIRMPTNFAVKMWNWTKMGARVIVTPGEIAAPTAFQHPLLPSVKVAPPPVMAQALLADAPLATKADKGAPEAKPSTVAADLDLRSTVGHGEPAKPVVEMTPVTLRDQTHTADANDANSVAIMSDAPSGSDATRPDVAESNKSGGVASAKAEDKRIEPIKADVAPANEKAAEIGKPAANVGASASEGKKDQTRLTKPEAPRRAGQIAVLISRKDSKIYVRQNFAPLFEAPVTIASSDRPLGTHVFTAEVDKADSNILHWSVVSLPASIRSAMRDDEERGSRRRKGLVAEARPVLLPDSTVEALDRIAIAPDTMARISEALTTGGSIIVTDQGVNQGDTGEGTDFIVSLR